MMRLSCLVVVLLLCFTAPVKPQQPAPADGTPAQKPSAPSGPVLLDRPAGTQARTPSAITPEGAIHLDVMVSDAAGKAVSGLGPQDFKLLDNNQARRILSFRSFDGATVKPNPPVQVILVIDTVNLPFTQIATTRQALATFLRQNNGRLAQPVSLMVLTDAGLRIQPRPSVDGDALLGVLNTVKGGIHTINPAMGSEGDLERLQLSLRKMTDIAENEALRPGRKLLIWIGPGWPMLDSKAFMFSDKDQRRYFDAIVELSTKIREARMVVDSVSLSDSATGAGTRTILYQDFLKGVTSARQADTGNLALKVLALQSGGRILGPHNDLAEQINLCVSDANAFYTLSFNPPCAEHANEYHDLKVTVAQSGLTARTTSGYYDELAAPGAGAAH